MKRVHLFDADDDASRSPDWWHNYVESNRITTYNVNELLKEHNAEYRIIGTHSFLYFETEGDHTMFVLKFA